MWLLDMKKFLQAAEGIQEAKMSKIAAEKDRVIRLLMGDELFLAEQTLESLADIINNDSQLVFEEYDCETITPKQLDELMSVPFCHRRRIL